MTLKCRGIDRNADPCRGDQLNDTEFCKYHQYMIDYTDEMLDNLSQCKGCKKFYYLVDYTTCDKCRNRGKKNRKRQKKQVIECKKEDCTYKRSKKNDYCGKHQVFAFRDEVKALGKKTCVEDVRGCKEMLELDSEYSRCYNCRIKKRKGYMKKVKKIEKVNKESNKVLCTKCGKDVDDTMYKHCVKCRISQKYQDLKRKGRKRDWKGELERNPERAAKKRKWQEVNWDRMSSYWTKSRAKKIKNKDEKYWKDNADQHSKWVQENIDAMREQWERDKFNPHKIIGSYMYRAQKRDIPWELKRDHAESLLKGKCYYCGCMDEGKLNGIDRMDNDNGYTFLNSVSCCKMCNMMKGCIDVDVFFKKCEHILTNLGFGKYELFWECFPDTRSIELYRYRSRAKKKNIPFNLTEIDYMDLRMGDCYICGKKASIAHMNGIDRIDNDRGYEVEDITNGIENNCASCCSECNYMKGSYSYEAFINKVYDIFNKSCKARIGAIAAKENENNEELQNYIKGVLAGMNKLNQPESCTERKCMVTQSEKDEYARECIRKMEKQEREILKNKSAEGDIDVKIKVKKTDLPEITESDLQLLRKKTSASPTKKKKRIKKSTDNNKQKRTMIKRGLFKDDHEAQKQHRRRQVNNANARYEARLKQSIGVDKFREKRKQYMREYRKKKNVNHIKVKKDKKTKEEIREAARIRKQQSRQRMKDKYGSEAWRLMHSKEIALQRARKTGNKELEARMLREIAELKKKQNNTPDSEA